MADFMLNNIRDVITGTTTRGHFSIEFSAHGVSESEATEIVAHLSGEGWEWEARPTPEQAVGTRWITGYYFRAPGEPTAAAEVALFLDHGVAPGRVLEAAGVSK